MSGLALNAGRGRVTVVIPTHNRCALLPAAIESVLRQSAADRCDIVVVDDGSTDDTPAVMARYVAGAAGRVRCISQRNRGVSAARNVPLRACTTEFVAPLDDDDAWLPDKIALQLAAFARWPAAVLVGGRVRECGAGAPARPVRPVPPVPLDRLADLAPWLIEANFLPPSAVMLRTDVLRRTGLFHERLQGVEDYHLWARIACQGPGVVLSDVVARYAVDSPGSLSARVVTMLARQLAARYLLRRQVRRRTDCAGPWRRGVLRSLTDLRDVCYRSGDFGHAARYGLQALLRDPLGRAAWEWRRCGAAAWRAAAQVGLAGR